MTTREIRFAADRSLGFVHVREGDYPFSFHGRYAKKGDGPAGLDGNEDWTLVGEAQGVVVVPADRSVMLEVLAESARDLSSLSTLAPDSINAIWLGNTWVDDEQLVHLSRLTGLQWLDIQNNGQITDNGIAQLRPLRSLRSLGLHWTRIYRQEHRCVS